MRRIICMVIGHSLWEWTDRCSRCLRDFDEAPRSDDGFWLSYYDWTYSLRFRVLRPVGHWLRCPDCGRRFGRHDKDRCIPF